MDNILFDAVPCACSLYAVDPEHPGPDTITVVDLNHKSCQLTRLTRAETQGQLACKLYPHWLPSGLGERFYQAYTQNHQGFLELFEYQGGKFNTGAYEIFIYAFPEKGQFMSCYMDQRQHILQTAHEKSQKMTKIFLDKLSHRIRGPLGVVVGHLDLMSQTDTLVQATQRQLLLVTNLLNDLTSTHWITAHDQEITVEHKSLPLYQICHELIKTYAGIVEDVEFRFEFLGPHRVQGDAHKLRFLLDHLINNAILFTMEGSVILKVTQDSIIITDTGVGMDTSQLPLDSVEPPTKYLGIWLCQRLVHAMGGQLMIKSQRGCGTQITIQSIWQGTGKQTPVSEEKHKSPMVSILKRVNDAIHYESPQLGSYRKRTYDHLRILIVEDTQSNYKILQKMLRRMQCTEIAWAKNGKQGVQLWEDASHERPFHLVLMDCNMPIMDGFEATRAIRRIEHDSKYIHPVFISSVTGVADGRAKCIEAGMNHYLCKPLQLKKLARTLATADLYQKERRNSNPTLQ